MNICTCVLYEVLVMAFVEYVINTVLDTYTGKRNGSCVCIRIFTCAYISRSSSFLFLTIVSAALLFFSYSWRQCTPYGRTIASFFFILLYIYINKPTIESG